MASTTKRPSRSAVPAGPYLSLIKRFPLRPLRSYADLKAAAAVIDTLSLRDDLTPDEDDYLDVLCTLVEVYEAEHYPIPDTPGPEMLRFLIEMKGVTQAEVAKSTGLAVSTINEILKGKRGLSRKHIEVLAPFFHVNPAVFLEEKRPAKGRPAVGKRNRTP